MSLSDTPNIIYDKNYINGQQAIQTNVEDLLAISIVNGKPPINNKGTNINTKTTALNTLFVISLLLQIFCYAYYILL